MRLIFLGPPGSGKGTQAKLLSERLGLCHIATGDLLREAVQLGTPEGRQAQELIAAGQLVPDALVNGMVRARFEQTPRPTRFVMDGYPRNLTQAQFFDDLLRSLGLSLDAVVFLAVNDDEIVQRISARWSCPNSQCKATYNTFTKPPRSPGRCDDCGAALAQRDDDQPATVRQRLQVYHQQTEGLLAYYRRQGLVKDVVGVGDIETIYQNLVAALAPPKP
ncbi:MAG: adenylate kinase [Gemmataceae bacterium]|nr:adenylate kinase [Gemmataceae bacterium]